MKGFCERYTPHNDVVRHRLVRDCDPGHTLAARSCHSWRWKGGSFDQNGLILGIYCHIDQCQSIYISTSMVTVPIHDPCHAVEAWAGNSC